MAESGQIMILCCMYDAFPYACNGKIQKLMCDLKATESVWNLFLALEFDYIILTVLFKAQYAMRRHILRISFTRQYRRPSYRSC